MANTYYHCSRCGRQVEENEACDEHFTCECRRLESPQASSSAHTVGTGPEKPDANETEGLYSIRLEIQARKAPVAALYSDLRLNPEQVPHGYYRYSIRETDGGSGEPATIERHVLMNHLMDILTTENLDSLIEKNDGYLNISDYDYDDSLCVSFPKSILSPRYFHD